MEKMNTESKKILINPQPSLQFIFSMFAIFTWLSAVVKIPDDSLITIEILEITLGIAAFCGSILNLIRGDQQGNINLILSVILGLSGGITQIISVAAHYFPITFHPWISSLVLLIGGLYMACFLPMLYKKPLYQFISHFCVLLGFLFSSLSMLLAIPVFKIIGAWFLFIFAVTGLYAGVSSMYLNMGIKIWQGPSLYKIFHK